MSKPIHFLEKKLDRWSAPCGFVVTAPADGRHPRFTRDDERVTCRLCLGRLDECATPGGRELDIQPWEVPTEIPHDYPLEPWIIDPFRLWGLPGHTILDIAAERWKLIRELAGDDPDRQARVAAFEGEENDRIRFVHALYAQPAEPAPPEATAPAHRPMLYAIQSVRGGPIKIGRTDRDPMDRLRDLQVSHAETLVLLASWEGTSQDEKRAHQKWAHLRMHGEWFDDAPELLEWIYEKKTGGVEWMGAAEG